MPNQRTNRIAVYVTSSSQSQRYLGLHDGFHRLLFSFQHSHDGGGYVSLLFHRHDTEAVSSKPKRWTKQCARRGSHLVRRERVHVLQQRLSHFRAAFKDARQLSGGQLQQDAVRLRLGPLAAFHKAFPHLGILPHLQGEVGG